MKALPGIVATTILGVIAPASAANDSVMLTKEIVVERGTLCVYSDFDRDYTITIEDYEYCPLTLHVDQRQNKKTQEMTLSHSVLGELFSQ
ncbi:hypothetical protein QTO01_12320 [Vibrio mytili]|uniref:Uncharacterized protein n=1 Tax=Vibrio mytili TaxID=50718 RepID=A0A0C3IA55_9VIBR|nr:hypothetical protein [Vibrio mytili]KIN11880.1 hypothetical protein SU60_05060 [Vibrio mytili]